MSLTRVAPATELGGSIRDRVIRAAVKLTVEHGWAAVTMAKLADRVGVSRQTVYNEVGTKQSLAEAMVMAELDHFLEQVAGAFEAHPRDLAAAVAEAAERVLVMARTNPLLHAALSTSQGAQSDLLPLLTIDAAPLLAAAGRMIRDRVGTYRVDLEPGRLEQLIDMVVRLVLSHVMAPGDSPARTAETIGWLARRVVPERQQPARG